MNKSAVTFKGILGLIGVWFGYGTIDILFKQVAKSGEHSQLHYSSLSH